MLKICPSVTEKTDTAQAAEQNHPAVICKRNFVPAGIQNAESTIASKKYHPMIIFTKTVIYVPCNIMEVLYVYDYLYDKPWTFVTLTLDPFCEVDVLIPSTGF